MELRSLDDCFRRLDVHRAAEIGLAFRTVDLGETTRMNRERRSHGVKHVDDVARAGQVEVAILDAPVREPRAILSSGCNDIETLAREEMPNESLSDEPVRSGEQEFWFRHDRPVLLQATVLGGRLPRLLFGPVRTRRVRRARGVGSAR